MLGLVLATAMKVGETTTTISASTRRSYEESSARAVLQTIASAKSGDTCIDDLPDVALVEILC